MTEQEIAMNEEIEDELAETIDDDVELEDGIVEEVETVEKPSKKAAKVEAKAEVKRAYVKADAEASESLLVLDKADKFYEFINSASQMVNEANIVFGKEGISIKALDPANVGMVEANMKSSAFITYKGEGTYALNLVKLKQMIKRGMKGSLRLTMTSFASIKLDNGKGKRLEYTMPLLADLEEKNCNLPELKLTNSIVCKTEDLFEAISDAEIVGESAALTFQSGKGYIEARGDLNKATIDLPGNAMGDDCKSKYSLEYLKRIMVKGFEKVKLETSKDYPLVTTYEKDNVKIRFLIAPRVENN